MFTLNKSSYFARGLYRKNIEADGRRKSNETKLKAVCHIKMEFKCIHNEIIKYNRGRDSNPFQICSYFETTVNYIQNLLN